MYNNKEEALYMVVNFSNQPVQVVCVKALSRGDAADGFKEIYKTDRISNVSKITARDKNELLELPTVERELILKALEEYVYYDQIRGRWRREVNRNGDNTNILNIQPGSSSGRKMILYFVDLPFQSEKAQAVVDYLTNVEKLNTNDVCYSTYDYRHADGTLNLIPAELSSEYYDSFGFVFNSPRYSDMGLIHSLYKTRSKKPSIYLVTKYGQVIEINRNIVREKEVLNVN